MLFSPSACRVWTAALVFLATAGPLGRYLPAPGSFGSLVGLMVVLGWPMELRGGAILGGLIGVMTVAGIAICSAAERRLSSGRDPGMIVWDEIVGQALALWLAWAWIGVPLGASGWTVACLVGVSFLSFRIFDISKWWVVGWCDRHCHGGFGMMLDDIAAAVLAALVTVLVYTMVPSLLSL